MPESAKISSIQSTASGVSHKRHTFALPPTKRIKVSTSVGVLKNGNITMSAPSWMTRSISALEPSYNGLTRTKSSAVCNAFFKGRTSEMSLWEMTVSRCPWRSSLPRNSKSRKMRSTEAFSAICATVGLLVKYINFSAIIPPFHFLSRQPFPRSVFVRSQRYFRCRHF